MRSGLLFALVIASALAGCAPTTAKGQYQRDFERLDASCKERQGILVATSGNTGHPETDYACRISGASRLGPSG